MRPDDSARAFEPGFAPPGGGGAPGIGGRLRERPEDFLVEEIPAYEPSGEGEHLYLLVEKRSLSTMELLATIARHFGVSQRAVGYAGLKDKRAITRQMVSVHLPGRAVEDIPSLRDGRVTILWADRHTNKLRVGHLRGNRFSIRVRGVGFEAALAAQRVLERLAREGLSNRFDEQRFGVLLNNHEVGRAIVLGRWAETADLLLGPSARAPDAQSEGRAMYAEGRFADALAHFPGSLHAERTMLRALAEGADPERAVRQLDRRAAAFYVSAFQSAVFNAVLNERERRGSAGRLLPGDRAFVHANGKTFEVTEGELARAETLERAARAEICPSGPMWGSAMQPTAGEPGEIETSALAEAGVDRDQIAAFAERTGLMEGGRRPLRVPVVAPEVEGGVDEQGGFVRCAFELPRGSFATSVMREIMGRAESPGAEDRSSDEPG